jgi:uncharacterized protein YndB with AHSA1/START domain
MSLYEPFEISHVANAPLEQVWHAWTTEADLLQWWGPSGLEMKAASVDVSPGGKFHYVMSNGADAEEPFELWGALEYVEVEPLQHIVFDNYFSDADGGKTRHFMNPDWPLVVRTTLTLVADGDKTLIHMQGGPIDASELEQKIYSDNFESMRIGFSGTFAQLDDFLAK